LGDCGGRVAGLQGAASKIEDVAMDFERARRERMRIIDIIPLGAVALGLAVVLTIIACVRQRRTIGQALWLFAARFFGLWYSLASLTLLFKLVTIRFALNDATALDLMGVNLKPFATITKYVGERNVVQILGNAAVLFPLPILIRLNFTKVSFRKTAAISAVMTVLIEPLQLLVNVIIRSPYNSIDIDDLILNAAGAAVGLLVTAAIVAINSKARRRNALR
jgi:glycopeptide antibiotics resistance protein